MECNLGIKCPLLYVRSLAKWSDVPSEASHGTSQREPHDNLMQGSDSDVDIVVHIRRLSLAIEV